MIMSNISKKSFKRGEEISILEKELILKFSKNLARQNLAIQFPRDVQNI